jgi:hypothetical protein
MKKVLAFGVAVLVAVSAQAQEFKPFKVNVSLGYALPSGGGGLLFAVEPKYGINDQIDVGLRIEGAGMARAVVVNGNDFAGDVSFAGSYLLTGNYMLSTNNFRPFVGAGVGLFGIASTSAISINGQTLNGDITAGNVFGGMVRAGFKTGHFVLGLEYNLIPASDVRLLDSSGQVQVGQAAQSKNSYLGIKLGFDIGGGRR